MKHSMLKPKVTSVVTLGLIVAVVGLGLGYAAWTDELTINADATTGQINLEWLEGPTWIDCDELPSPEPWAETSAVRALGDAQLIEMLIKEAYPGYEVRCEFFAKNLETSTMPVNLAGLYVENNFLTSGGSIELDVAGDAQNDIKVTMVDGTGVMVPGDTENKTVIVKVLSGAPMEADISFQAHVAFTQGVGP